MFVPPNWVGLGVFGMLGFLNFGFWILGFGCELAYLGWLSSHPRFQRVVEGGRLVDEQRQWQSRLFEMIRQLQPDDQQRYRALEARCKEILQHQGLTSIMSPELEE